MECCICKKEIEKQYTEEGVMFWDQGNNAQPIDDGRCCNDCNRKVVIPARMAEIKLAGVMRHHKPKSD